MKSDKIWEIKFPWLVLSREPGKRRDASDSRLASHQPSRRILVYPRGSPSHLVRALGRGRVFELVFSKQVQEWSNCEAGVSICVTRWTSERRWASRDLCLSLCRVLYNGKGSRVAVYHRGWHVDDDAFYKQIFKINSSFFKKFDWIILNLPICNLILI